MSVFAEVLAYEFQTKKKATDAVKIPKLAKAHGQQG